MTIKKNNVFEKKTCPCKKTWLWEKDIDSCVKDGIKEKDVIAKMMVLSKMMSLHKRVLDTVEKKNCSEKRMLFNKKWSWEPRGQKEKKTPCIKDDYWPMCCSCTKDMAVKKYALRKRCHCMKMLLNTIMSLRERVH